MAWVVVLAARKGGVGKTSLAVNLAGCAVCDGLSVAVVDLDSQASASRWALGREAVDRLAPGETALAISRVQSDGVGGFSRVQSVGSGAIAHPQPGPGGAGSYLHSVVGLPLAVIVPTAPQCRLDGVVDVALRELPVDVVFVDTPPDVGAGVVRAALRQADVVLSPVVAEAWGLESVPEIVGVVRDVRGTADVRFVINLRQRRALHDAVEVVLRREYGGAVLKSVVGNAAQLAESAARGQPLSVFAARSPAAKSVSSVWRELVKLRRAAEAA